MGDPRSVRYDGKRYPVIEMFTSVQSEGARCGTLNHFLRLGGCNMYCPFCDTPMHDFTWLTPEEISVRLWVMQEKTPTRRQLIITGGEPLVHDLRPLFDILPSDYYIAMESNGILVEETRQAQPEVLDRLNWLTVSPKRRIPTEVLKEEANEVKYVIPDHEMILDLEHPLVFVQPEFGNKDSIARCLKLMSLYPSLRLSVQTHKYIGVR